MKRYLLTFVLLMTVLFPTLSQAREASVDRLFVGVKPNLNLSFVIKDAFKPEIEEAIKSGIPTTFTIFVELNRVRRLWPDKTVKKWSFKHTVKYDNLKDDYEVTLEEFDKKIRTNDFEEMKRLMVTGSAIELITQKPIREGARHTIRMMAQLDTIKLPFLVRHMLFFVKIWDFKTDWYVFDLPM
jgi:hypothetical protein